MKNYKHLGIYRLCYYRAVKVHRMTLKLPKYEMYGEGSQVRKSSKGIPACIVEGYGRRKYKAEFTQFLIYAHASCDETILHLNLLKDTNDVDEKEMEYFLQAYDELGSKIYRFIQYVEKEWKGRN